ncbi:DUF2079 domain-containing protein [Spirillospora sp. NPDC047279]|uniref:DUF2079 domain-containing protein n=1 Tax=Spirillospora sp. NPDC047279 TaxID=3155478 RepID=UPI0034034FF6
MTYAETAVAVDEAPEARRSRFDPRDRPRLDPYVLAVLFFVAYAVLSVSRFVQMESRSWDLGIFEQVVRSYAHLEAPVADLKGPGFAILGDHFSPILMLIAPFYRLFPTPVTLLVAQALLFAGSVIPVTRVAAHLLGRARGIAVGAAFGLSWGVQGAIDFDFHEICFAVPLIALSLEAVLLRRWRTALLWAIPLLLVKEDLGLTVAALALIVVIRAWPVDRSAVRLGLAVAGVGVLGFLLTVGVIIPAFNAGGGYDYWSKLDPENSTPGTAVLNGLGEKSRTVLWILVPTTGLLALRSPLLIAAVPTLAWRFASQEPSHWGTAWHYDAVLMPIVSLALVDAIARTRFSSRLWQRSYAYHLPFLALAVALALTTTRPLAILFQTATYTSTPTAKGGERALSVIPDGASVEANVRPIAHLTGRCRVLWVGNTAGLVPDYIAYHDAGQNAESLIDYARVLHPTATYKVVAHDTGFWILQRTSP